MRVLLVTGRLAEPIVKTAVRRAEVPPGVEVSIEVLPIDVAAFITTGLLVRLIGSRARGYDLVVVPGLSRVDTAKASRLLGVRVAKGPKNAADLDVVLSSVDVLERLGEEPADRIIEDVRRSRVSRVLRAVEERASRCIELGAVFIPCRPPPIRVAAEVIDADAMARDSLEESIARFVEWGADILVLNTGCRAAEKLLDLVRGMAPKTPVALDLKNWRCLPSLLDAGADMLMSVDEELVRELPPCRDEDRCPAIVAVPQVRRGERIASLRRAVDALRYRGYTRVVADPIVDPPTPLGLYRVLRVYDEASQVLNTPLLAGLCNVVELVDADSPGLVMALTMLFTEVGASILLVTEASRKTFGAVKEASTAAAMVSAASALSKPPKDLGLDLLILKEKVGVDIGEPRDVAEVVEAGGGDPVELDPVGSFRIGVSRRGGYLWALYMGRRGRILIRGRRAADIYREAIRLGLVSRLDHAAYLGYELAKAEIALVLGRSYIQEQDLFRNTYVRSGHRV